MLERIHASDWQIAKQVTQHDCLGISISEIYREP